MQEIKVSVIVAIYNTEKYLRQCLESIVNQTLKDIEVICVNDGSTDDSLEIIESFAKKDNRIRVFTKENEGLGAASARNYGLERVQGKYVSILDSDDFFELDMLEKAYERAEATEADIVVFGGNEYDDKNGNIRRVATILNENVVPTKEVFSYKDCPKSIYQLTPGMAWNKLYRRTFLKKKNLRFQRIKYTDDLYFTLSYLVLAERITVLRERLCYYRVNTGISQTDGLAAYPDSTFVSYITLKQSLIEWGIYEDVKQSFVNCALEFMQYAYDRIGVYNVFEYLHNKYRDEVFPKLGIVERTEDYFYNKRVYEWCRQIIDNSARELVFKALRAHGGDNTAVLRMRFPYEKIPGGSRIVIIGAETMGRQYYSQIMLSRYCDVVMLVAKDNPSGLSYVHGFEALKDVEFDYALIASAQQGMIDEAFSVLRGIGFPDERIVFG